VRKKFKNLKKKLKTENKEKDLIAKYKKKDLLKLEKKQRKYSSTVLEEQKDLEKEKLFHEFTPLFYNKTRISKKHPLLVEKENYKRRKSLNAYLLIKSERFNPFLSFSKYPNLIQHSKFHLQHFKNLRKAKSSTLTRWRFKKILNKKRVGKVFRVFFYLNNKFSKKDTSFLLFWSSFLAAYKFQTKNLEKTKAAQLKTKYYKKELPLLNRYLFKKKLKKQKKYFKKPRTKLKNLAKRKRKRKKRLKRKILRLPKLRKKPKRARLLRRSVRTRKRRKMLRFGLDLNRAHSPLFINKIRFRTWKKRYTQGRAVAKKRKKNANLNKKDDL